MGTITFANASTAQVWSGALSDTGFTVAADLDFPSATQLIVAAAADTNFSNPVYIGASTAPSLTDKNGGGFWYSVKHTATGLNPNTAYRYALKSNGLLHATVGLVKTAPRQGSPAAFSIVFGACSNFALGTVEALGAIATNESDCLFFAHLGDIAYDDYTGTDITQKRAATRFTRLYRSGATSLCVGMPLVYSWSDHDSAANDQTKSSVISGTTYDAVMAQSLTVYKETVPHYTLGDAATLAIAQSWWIGSVFFIMPDCQTFRDSNGAMLGSAQTSWVVSQVSAAVAAGATLVVMLSAPEWLSSPYLGWQPTWAAEAKALLDSLKGISGMPGFIILDGDAHSIGADDGTNCDVSTGGGMKIVNFRSTPFLQTTLTPPTSSWKGTATQDTTNGRVYCRVDFNAANNQAVATFKGRNSAGTSFPTVATYNTADLSNWA